MEDIERMRDRHEREIEELQRNCEHLKHHRSAYMWAPGHFGNDVEVCETCGKILKTYETQEASKSKSEGKEDVAWSLTINPRIY
jgi:hypothetical protein